MALEVQIDDGVCMGVGLCIALAPDVFRWNDTKSQALVVDSNADDEAIILEAVSNCPNFAITAKEV